MSAPRFSGSSRTPISFCAARNHVGMATVAIARAALVIGFPLIYGLSFPLSAVPSRMSRDDGYFALEEPDQILTSMQRFTTRLVISIHGSYLAVTAIRTIIEAIFGS